MQNSSCTYTHIAKFSFDGQRRTEEREIKWSSEPCTCSLTQSKSRVLFQFIIIFSFGADDYNLCVRRERKSERWLDTSAQQRANSQLLRNDRRPLFIPLAWVLRSMYLYATMVHKAALTPETARIHHWWCWSLHHIMSMMPREMNWWQCKNFAISHHAVVQFSIVVSQKHTPIH